MLNKSRLCLAIVVSLGLIMGSVYAQNSEVQGRMIVTISDIGDDFGECIELSVKNPMIEDVYLAKWDVASDGDLTKSLFRVLSEKGELYTYSGKTIKRSEPTVNDLIRIQPGGDISSKIKVANFYRANNAAVGEIAYSAFVPVYRIEKGVAVLSEFIQLDSNKLKKQK